MNNKYDWKQLRNALYDALDEQIDKLKDLDPDPGIIDLRLSNLAVDNNDVSKTININTELVELVEGTWIEEATSAWTTTIDHFYDENWEE